jgi:hypothetical protein
MHWPFDALPDVLGLFPLFTLPAELRETRGAANRRAETGHGQLRKCKLPRGVSRKESYLYLTQQKYTIRGLFHG